MNLDDVVAKLDANNSFSKAFADWMKDELNEPVFARKGKDLPEVVLNFIDLRKFPLVDKKLGIVFGVMPGNHEMLRAYLQTYHEGKLSERGLPDPEFSATQYLKEGRGYYISVMRKRVVVAGINYQPDRFDKDLFMLFQLDQTL